MSTAEINAYLEWRAEREGKTVDVSPEAYNLQLQTEKLFSMVETVLMSRPPEEQNMAEKYLQEAHQQMIFAQDLLAGLVTL